MTNLGYCETKCIFEVFRLRYDEKVEAPAATEVSHDDGPDSPGGDERLPWRLHKL